MTVRRIDFVKTLIFPPQIRASPLTFQPKNGELEHQANFKKISYLNIVKKLAEAKLPYVLKNFLRILRLIDN